MDLGLFNLPLFWLSPLAGTGAEATLSARTGTEPVPRSGHAGAHAGARAVVGADKVCSAWSMWSVPPAEAVPGRTLSRC